MKDKYSGKEVIRAGEAFLTEEIFKDKKKLHHCMEVLSYWRFKHEIPLENALKTLKNEVKKKDKTAIFAKRLKRYPSIVSKLKRFPKMKLKNMQDIGGCRTIISSEKKLFQVVKELKKKAEFKNNQGIIRFKDYIKNPKLDGYRGYHLIGTFLDQDGAQRSIELQLRTEIQHDWATALEIVDLFTGQALKSNIGDSKWKDFFKLVSEHFSLMESIHLFSSKEASIQLEQYRIALSRNPEYGNSGHNIQKLESNLQVVRKLEAFSQSLKIADEHIAEVEVHGYVLIKVDTKASNVISTIFQDDKNAEAEEMYLQYEKDANGNKDIVVALVSTTAVGGIKEAYPNYFADSSEFLKYLTYILRTQMKENTTFLERLLKGMK